MTLAFARPPRQSLRTWIRRAANTTLDLLLPPACLLCGDFLRGDHPPVQSNSEVMFCRACLGGLRNWPPNLTFCGRCALPQPIPTAASPCWQCKSWKLHFDRAIPLAMYHGAMAEAVVAAKSPRNAALASQLGRLLSQQIQSLDLTPQPDLVTWVPAHLFRKIQRKGTPGVELIARQVAQLLKIPALGMLRTVRYVRKQALLDDKNRLVNVRGAFALKKSYAWRGLPNLRDRHILLVDDVLTTGATASEIAKVLKEAGAGQVSLAVLARAVRG